VRSLQRRFRSRTLQPINQEKIQPILRSFCFFVVKNFSLPRSSAARFRLAIGFSPYMSGDFRTADFPGELLDEHH
jgi:hypothetical protein